MKCKTLRLRKNKKRDITSPFPSVLFSKIAVSEAMNSKKPIVCDNFNVRLVTIGGADRSFWGVRVGDSLGRIGAFERWMDGESVGETGR